MENGFASRTSQAWWFEDRCAADIQSIVGTGFGKLPFGLALMLSLPQGAGGGWLRAVDVTTAAVPRDGQTHAVTLALTSEGLLRSGLPKAALDRFDAPFREGMTQPDRARRLGDTPDDADGPGTLVPGGLLWSGAARADRVDPARDDPPPLSPDYAQVDALLLLYASTEEVLEAEAVKLVDALSAAGVTVARRLPLTPAHSSDTDAPREHFGFVDGISQPFPQDAPGTSDADRAIRQTKVEPAVDAALAHHRIRTGDVLFGRTDAYGERPGGIFLDAEHAAALPQGAAPPGQRDFGWNGSFLVARELVQDVENFWREMAALAEAQALPALTIAEKLVGRGVDGAFLKPEGATNGNDFGFGTEDRHGFGCPIGSHVRRSNPRDTGARDEGEQQTRRDSANNHRILRRGRNFGPAAFAGAKDAAGRPPETAPEAKVTAPKARRGLLFMCLNTDIIRQFEFVQQTWIMNRQFGGLDQTDPIVGPAGLFSIPFKPVRRRVPINTYVRLAGGDYFFLPSRSALAWLATRTAADAAGPAPVAAGPAGSAVAPV